MREDIKKLMWALLITKGNVGEWNYYGAGYGNNIDKLKKCITEILEHGVDWKKTKSPRDGNESSFIDTFSDSDDHNKVLEGTLFLNNGKSYHWGVNFQDADLSDMVETIVGIGSFDSVVSNYHFNEVL